jgi:ankyrin repeat protein
MRRRRTRETALMTAALYAKKDVVRYLLSKGASKSLKNSQGESAADMAKDPEVKALLK